jgi:hypothetical protein
VNRVESSRQASDPIMDNNNPPDLTEGILLLEFTPVQPALTERVQPSQPRSNSLQFLLNEDAEDSDDERARNDRGGSRPRAT